MAGHSRVALVTGSGKKRVGSVVAERLAEKGYSIALHYRTSDVEAQETAESLRKYNIEVKTYQADISIEDEVQRMVQSVLKEFGRIDLLVNCAAIWEPKPLEHVTAADVRNHFEINALGTFLCCQQVGLAMTKQKEGGVIINLGDWAEARPYLGYAAYFPSKGAVTAITRTFAVELGSRNPKVRVNQIMPGPVMLPADMPSEEKQKVIQATLVKREGRPHHVAQAVISLIENDFITGVCLPIDGGRTIYANEKEDVF